MSRPHYKPIEADEAIKHIKAGNSKNVYIAYNNGELICSDKEKVHIDVIFDMSWYLCEQEQKDIMKNIKIELDTKTLADVCMRRPEVSD